MRDDKSNTIVELQNVGKVFPVGANIHVKAVDDVSLTVNKGVLLMISGPNGSGKTTLLSIIGCMIKPSNGKIFVCQEEVDVLTQNQLSNFRLTKIGFIFQTFRLLDALSVSDNVELVLSLNHHQQPQLKNRTSELLEKVGISHRKKFLPQSLSGGEKQRVAIARALVNNPQLILADEPTGSLDSKSGQSIIELLRSIAVEEKRTVIVVSHDDRIRRYADRIIYMEDGKIIGQN